MVALGKALFFDDDLSANGTHSCAACHGSEVGFTGPDALVNAGEAVYPGAIANRFGNRKPPAAAYAGDSPVFYFDETTGVWFGGMFWDGRATGAHLVDPLAEQAQGPFLNPLEQAIANPQVLCVRVKQAYSLASRGSGARARSTAPKTWLVSYEKIGRSVAAYERARGRSIFSSKFDLFWDNAAGARKDVTMISVAQAAAEGGGGIGYPGRGSDSNRWTAYRNLATATL